MPTYTQSISNRFDILDDFLSDYLKFPERRLAYAVINRALYDLESYQKSYTSNTATSEQYNHAKDARYWLRSQSTERYSFIWLAEEVFPDTMTAAVLQNIDQLSRPDLKPPVILTPFEPFPTAPDQGP